MLFLHKLKLRDVIEPCVLIGPTITNAKPCEFAIDGTVVSLLVPKHSTTMPTKPPSPKYEYSIKEKYFKNLTSTDDGWGGYILFLVILIFMAQYSVAP